jgi:tetratricopeptide (TPR) repeat protein
MTADIDLPVDALTTHPLVGRERELAGILACLDRAAEGRGSLVFVMGAPGIGKSRLVDEVASVAMARGTPVFWGRCWDTAGAPPYWPWVQALRAYLRNTNPDDLKAQLGVGAANVVQILPELGELIPGLAPPPATDPESARFQLFDSITTFLLNASRSRGLVLVIDDVHAADLASILLLRFLGKQVREGPLVVVGTYRDVELTPDHPLSEALPDLAREPSTVFVELLGLTEASTRSIAAESAGFDPRPALIKALHRSTGGNPLFIRETIRLLVAEGRLTAESDTDSLSVAVVPARVHEVIARRLTHVSEPARHLLLLAAVIGPEFSIDAIRAVVDPGEQDVLDGIDETVEAGLLGGVPGAPGRFRFTHELIRETLYADVAPATRGRLHRRVALALEELYGSDSDAHLAELAHHFFEAASAGDQPTRALDYAIRAGEQASRELAYEAAAGHFGMALTLLESQAGVDRRVQADLLLALGEAQDRSGNRQEARRTFLRAAGVARNIGAAESLARAALGYGGRFVWERAGRDTHLVPLLQDALVMLGGQDDRLRSRLLARLACALRSEPNRELNDTLSQQAVDLARSLDDPATLAYAVEGRFFALWWPETAEERLSIAREMRTLAADAGDAERVAWSHAATYGALGDLGRMTEARAEADVFDRHAQELRQPAQRWVSGTLRVPLMLMEGRFEEAEERIVEQLETGIIERDELSSTRGQLFLLRREQGRLREIEEVNKSSIGDYPWFPVHRAERALLLVETGRRKEAQSLLDELSRNRFAVFYRDNEWIFEMSITSEVAALLEDRDAATILYEELTPFGELHAAAWAEGSVGAASRYLGLLAATLGDLDAAVGHLEHAERFNERMGARPWTIRTRADLGRVLLRRGGAADRARAHDLLEGARSGAAALGMVALANELDLGADSHGARAEPVAHPSAEHTFRREGDYWLVEFDGPGVRVRDTKGMQYLARLLASPGHELHVLDLAGAAATAPGDAPPGTDLPSEGLGDSGARLDPQAKAEYRRRVEELRADIAEADSWNDPERAAQAREELEFLAQELSGAIGLGGRDRKAASASERARLSVTRAIRSAMNRLRGLDPALGAHLDATIRTGTYCVYTPDPRAPVRWVD